MSDQKSWFPSEGADNAVTKGDSRAVSSPPPRGRVGRLCGRIWRVGGDKAAAIGVFSGVVAAGVLLAPGTAAAKPCEKHTRYTKVTKAQCVKAHRAQVKRDRMAFPPRPTWNEALARLDAYEERSLLAIGRCEMGTRSPGYTKAKRGFPPAASPWARLRWGLDYSRYSTAFGIWNGNGSYIRRTTGYAFPGRTPAEELLGAMALADGPARGFSGWACHGRS